MANKTKNKITAAKKRINKNNSNNNKENKKTNNAPTHKQPNGS